MRIDNFFVYNNNFEYIKIYFEKYIIQKKKKNQSEDFKSHYLKENDDRYHKIATNTSGSKKKGVSSTCSKLYGYITTK